MNKIGFKKIVLSASLVLAMAFTLSCSAQDENNENNVVYGPSVTYEGETYKSVVIGSQTWMARNLNYNASGSRCFDDVPTNCDKYGRLYDWNTAMDACPPGWHLPSLDEWSVLEDNAGGYYYGQGRDNLMAKSEGGNDKYGFAGLLGGCYSGGVSYSAGVFGVWQTTEEHGNMVYVAGISNLATPAVTKTSLLSVRCVLN